MYAPAPFRSSVRAQTVPFQIESLNKQKKKKKNDTPVGGRKKQNKCIDTERMAQGCDLVACLEPLPAQAQQWRPDY